MKSRLIILLILSLSILDLSCNSSRDRGNPSGYMDVTKVVDGDTFWADDGSEKGIKIRLIGVDAPESRNTGQKKIGYYGQQSKEFLTKLLANKKVRLEYDVGKKDQYNRTLAYVYLTDGTFVNAELVKQGYAMVMTIPPNVKYAERFVKLARKARKNNRGLWNERNLK
jgi:micrococcal nuclease